MEFKIYRFIFLKNIILYKYFFIIIFDAAKIDDHVIKIYKYGAHRIIILLFTYYYFCKSNIILLRLLEIFFSLKLVLVYFCSHYKYLYIFISVFPVI